MGATLLCGDVHGCIDELDELVRTVGPGVEVIGLGDLIDRGPDPVGVVRRSRENSWKSIAGNHEDKALRWLRHEAVRRSTGKKNPMRKVPEDRKAEWEALSQDDVAWLRSMPVSLPPAEGWWAVHAGFEPGVVLEEQETERMLRVRFVDPITGMMVPYRDGSLDQPEGTVYWTRRWAGPGNVVYGHAVHSKLDPRVDACDGGWTCYGIDTGCCFGGRLTGMLLKDGGCHEFVQVQAKSEYFKMPGYGSFS